MSHKQEIPALKKKGKPSFASPTEKKKSELESKAKQLLEKFGRKGPLEGTFPKPYPEYTEPGGKVINETSPPGSSNKPKSSLPEVQLTYLPGVEIYSEKITSSEDASRMFESIFERESINVREVFAVACLNRANRPLYYMIVGKGGISSVMVDIRLIFMAALKAPVSAILLCHNHPSGQLRPSDQDIALTKEIVTVGKIFDIHVLDHIILTSKGYYSFANDGLI